jgi:hypothetical protein
MPEFSPIVSWRGICFRRPSVNLGDGGHGSPLKVVQSHPDRIRKSARELAAARAGCYQLLYQFVVQLPRMVHTVSVFRPEVSLVSQRHRFYERSSYHRRKSTEITELWRLIHSCALHVHCWSVSRTKTHPGRMPADVVGDWSAQHPKHDGLQSTSKLDARRPRARGPDDVRSLRAVVWRTLSGSI